MKYIWELDFICLSELSERNSHIKEYFVTQLEIVIFLLLLISRFMLPIGNEELVE